MWLRRGSAALAVWVVLTTACSRQETVQYDKADSLIVGYWDLPLAEQGKAPQDWPEVERSLEPEDCGRCHPDQLRDWSSALHSKAFSPGLVGQLINYEFEEAAACMECHAPLAEQRRGFELARIDNRGHQPQAQGLAATGNGCAGCHVRAHRRHGPPRRPDKPPLSEAGRLPHDGAYRTSFFESSDFCRECHQFPEEMAINGKPLENTYVEWQASPQAAEGITCQGCHMPDRRHLWRGIHDRETVTGGLDAQFHVDGDGARFELTSTGIGHAFPTYITPKVMMRAVALDAAGNPISQSEVSRLIQRKVDSVDGEWIERFDTRLMPGETATLEIGWHDAARVKMWLEVHPDDYYDHYVYDVLLDQLDELDPARELIAEADRRAVASRYSLFESILERP